MKMMKFKGVIYLGLAVGILIYAVPKLQLGQGLTLPSIFGAVWISMILLIIAAHLHQLIGVDEETKKELLRIKHHKRVRLEQLLTGERKILQARK